MDGEADRWAKVMGFTDEDTTQFKAAILDIAHEHLGRQRTRRQPEGSRWLTRSRRARHRRRRNSAMEQQHQRFVIVVTTHRRCQ